MGKRDPVSVGEAFDVMVLASDSVHRSTGFLARWVRVLVPTVIGLALSAGFMVYEVESLKDSSEQTRISSEKAAIAASAAKEALDAAIANSQQQSESSNDAIKRINEIYDTCVVKKEC